MSGQVLLFVPLDDRPVTMDFVVDLARAAGVEVRVPDQSMLGDRNRGGDVDRVWDWLNRQMAAGGATAMIASVDMLCFGGLVAARKSEAEFEAIAPRLLRLREVASRVPTYVSAVIPRTLIFSAEKDVPSRRRHTQLNTNLIDAASQELFRCVLIGQDDTSSHSQSQADREMLEAHAQAVASNVLVTTGADELNVRLLARWLNDLAGHSPAVRILYTYPEGAELIPLYESTPLIQTVGEHVRSAGCSLADSSPEIETDILLWVHNFKDQPQEAWDQPGTLDPKKLEPILKQVGAATQSEKVVALADVRFANGADRALVSRLLDEPQFTGIVAYAGWNTCSNTLGSAIAQAVLVHHLRANTLPGRDRIFRPVLFSRILDDWGYQALVRPQLARWLEDQGGVPTELGTYEGTAETLALQGLRGDALPLLQASFPHHPITINRVAFPWHRLFEIRIDLERVPELYEF